MRDCLQPYVDWGIVGLERWCGCNNTQNSRYAKPKVFLCFRPVSWSTCNDKISDRDSEGLKHGTDHEFAVLLGTVPRPLSGYIAMRFSYWTESFSFLRWTCRTYEPVPIVPYRYMFAQYVYSMTWFLVMTLQGRHHYREKLAWPSDGTLHNKALSFWERLLWASQFGRNKASLLNQDML